MTKEIKKSIKLVITAAVGMINLGKYTLLMRLALPIRLPLASLNAFEKNCQGNIAAYTMMAYGAVPSLGKLAILLNTSVKMIMVNNGLMMLQSAPTTVCLYRTLMSLQLRI